MKTSCSRASARNGKAKNCRAGERSRRDHRIVLNIGDDLADFLPDVRRATPLAREQARCAADSRWGRQWFLLPNPMYGSWLVALGQDFGSALEAEPQVKQDCQDP